MKLVDGANTVRVILADKATLTSPVYIILFVNDNTGEKYMCTTSYTTVEDELQQFTITVTDPATWTSGQVALGKLGFYHYYVYERANLTGLVYNTIIAADISTYVPTYFTSEVACGKMEYQDATQPTLNIYKNTVSSVKAYGD
jgi:hypothetical protein